MITGKIRPTIWQLKIKMLTKVGLCLYNFNVYFLLLHAANFKASLFIDECEKYSPVDVGAAKTLSLGESFFSDLSHIDFLVTSFK